MKVEKINIRTTNEIVNLEVQPINIVVGPNNSGKSLFLREIRTWFIYNYFDKDKRNENKIIENFIINQEISDDEITTMKANLIKSVHNPSNYVVSYNSGNPMIGDYHDEVSEDELDSIVHEARETASTNERFELYYYGAGTKSLDGKTRLSALDDFSISAEQAINFNKINDDLIINLSDDFSIFEDFQQYIYDSFNVYPNMTIRPNGLAHIVLSKEKLSEEKQLSYSKMIRETLNDSLDNNSTSDGRKAFIGVLAEVLTGNPRLLLIDEPEAFLHPPLAKELGNIVSEIIRKSELNKQLFVSTHSPYFVMGCVESGVPMNIIRLTYENQTSTANIINSDIVKKMMTDPLLRSTNILSALFHKYVFVTESDSDRVFYQEILYRMKESGEIFDFDDYIFLNAQNKQTASKISYELRKMGILSISILDIDMLKDNGKEFTKYLHYSNISDTMQGLFITMKQDLVRNYTEKYSEISDVQKKGNSNKAIDVLKKKGIKELKKYDGLFELGVKLFDDLKEYGQFVVPVGELECWLPEIHAHGHGNNWITEKLANMGHSKGDENYLPPSNDDVWLFMSQIVDWFKNKDRKGM